jgi:hypothetical protein
VVELDELGRAALAVLDGGLFVGTRVVELAEAYLEKVSDDAGNAAKDDDGGEVAS